MSTPPTPRFDPAQWQRLKGPLADLAELPTAARADALRRMQLDDDDTRALAALVATLTDDEARLPAPPSTAATDRVSLLRWQIGDRVDDYVIDGLLGRGGMGEVYAAHVHPTGERVALKVLRQGLDQGDFAHFSNNEQRALQRLDDPQIARFIEALALPDRSLCLVLEQVEGESLTAWCERARPDVDVRLALFIQICQAVTSAHQQLVVHRDLKPGNVLVTNAGQIKLLDFGIAKLLDDDAAATQTRGGLYTLEYAAPEQILRNPVSTSTDIYALGALLFHLLTGKTPYAVNANESLVKAVLSDAPRRLASADHASTWDPDLDRIIARAMEKDPRDRYRSAVELASDVQAIRDGLPIGAGGGRWYRVAKFVRRHPVGVAMSGLMVLVLMLATGVSLNAAARAEAQARLAREESSRANAVVTFLVGLFKDSDPGVNRGDKLTANQILERGANDLARTLADQPLQRARLQLVTGDVYVAMGEFARARDVLEPALETLGETEGASSLDHVHGLRLLAQVARSQAHFDESLAVIERAEVLLASNHIESADEQARLALLRLRTCIDLSQFPEAQAALNEARRHALAMTPPELELEGAIHAAAADLGDEMGDYAIARHEYGMALDKLGQSIGDDHYRTVSVRTNFGAMLVTKFDDLDAAQPLLEKALAQWLKLRGADSAAYASTANTLGELFRHRADHARAATLFADSERAYRAALGDAHPSITWPIRNHAHSLDDQGRFREALAEYERALAIVIASASEAPVRTAEVRKQIIDVLIPLKRYQEASDLGASVLAVFREHMPADHATIVNTLYQIGFARYGLGDKAGAEIAWREALERAPRAFAHRPKALADMRAEIADPDAELGKYAKQASH
jgi:tetratricopeptide (TPR) repeat protein